MFLVLPAGRVPAALELGALDQANGLVALDQRDAVLDHGAVLRRPVLGYFCDGGGAVALEPGGLLAAGRQAPGQHDFEGALAQRQCGRVWA
ncbi:hypothetical protein D3C71_1874960 [compost metagenome]